MHSNSSIKEQYRLLCENRNDIPMFLQAWWMDAVCLNKEWDVIIYTKNDKIIASWVFHTVKKYGMSFIIQPQLTQLNGIWIDFPKDLSKNEKISYESKIMEFLISQISEKKFSFLEQSFHYSLTNWLPFYWNGYNQSTRYTYQIEDISNIEKCFSEFHTSKKTHIKKAQKTVSIDFNLTGNEFYDHLQNNLMANNKKVSYTKKLFINLYEACISRNQGGIIAAYDNEGNLHGALFIVWDHFCSYNLISTINPKFRSSGATSLLFFEAIKMMSSKTKTFDFEGSMNKGIEKSFREFGAIQIPYFQISKSNSFAIETLYRLKKYLNSKK